VECPKCETPCADEANFCSSCGSPLHLVNSQLDSVDGLKGSFSGDPSKGSVSTSSANSVCPIHRSPCLLDMVLRSSACLTQTMDVEHFLEVVTEELVKSMEVDAAGILLFDDRLNDFYWRDVRDPNHVLSGNAAESRRRIYRTALDQAFQSGESLVVGDGTIRSAPQSEHEVHAETSLRNALIVPLNTREKTTGLLVLANKKTGPFKERDINVMVSLAGVVAMSLENADFFEELLGSYRKAVSLDRMKSKILHRLSHELKTPLAVMKASLRHVETGLKERGINNFDAAFTRLFRQVENLGRLELQVNSIMKRGYAEEREMISGVLESAASLIEVQAEETPEIGRVASLLLKTLEDAFPGKQEQWGRIEIKEFGESVIEYVRNEMSKQDRHLNLIVELDSGSEIMLPNIVLHAIMEGLVRNAVESTPDNGTVSVRGRSNGNFYVFTVEDSGIGIPEEDWGLVFDGFFQVQETDDYTSGRPYAFDAGGKGMDLFRIKMFSRIYGFGVYFRSRRCRHLIESLRKCPGNVDRCPYCTSVQDCIDSGGTVFEVDLPLTGGKGENTRSV
jgi:signal transduction histidine kinase